jgi:hypothetical protein
VGYMSLLGVGRGGGASPASPAWSDASAIGINHNYASDTYLFDDVAIGSADADRTVIFAVSVNDGAAINSVSVNSGAITPTLIHSTAGGGATVDVHLYMAEIPTGTTCDISVTANQAMKDVGLAILKATGVSASAPTGTAIDEKEAGFDANPIELTLVVPSGGFGVVAGANVHDNGLTASNGGTAYVDPGSASFQCWVVVKDSVSGSQTFGVNLTQNFSGSAAVGAAFGA